MNITKVSGDGARRDVLKQYFESLRQSCQAGRRRFPKISDRTTHGIERGDACVLTPFSVGSRHKVFDSLPTSVVFISGIQTMPDEARAKRSELSERTDATSTFTIPTTRSNFISSSQPYFLNRHRGVPPVCASFIITMWPKLHRQVATGRRAGGLALLPVGKGDDALLAPRRLCKNPSCEA